MSFSNKRFILWDHDGVLVDTERWYYAALREAMSPLGVDFDQATYLDCMADGRTYWDLATARGATQEQIDRQRQVRNQLYREFLQREPIEIPGVREVLEELSTRFRMAVVTTSRRTDFDLIHRSRDLLSRMEFVLTLEDYSEAKPHPAPYLAALARFGADPATAVAIEDSSRGLKSAVAAGLDCLIIRHPFTATQNFSGARELVNSIRDLPALLREG
jgi:HAD superfamily hydrolase (TIGR01509 family)